MDVAGALLPFTQVVRPELTIHVQEVLTQADKDNDGQKSRNPIPEINEPSDNDELLSPLSKNVDNPKSDTYKSSKDVNTRGVPSAKISEVRSADVVKLKNSKKGNPAWWLLVVLPTHGKKHVHFEATDKVYYFWLSTDYYSAAE